jgi:hypothetical protein
MTPVESEIGSFTSTLEIELLATEVVRPKDLAQPLENLEWLCATAAALASSAEDFGEEPFSSRARRLRPTLVRVRYGSPFVALLSVPEVIAAHASAMALLICGLKYLWGFDLELRSRREEQRARFYEAQEEALRARMKLQEFIEARNLSVYEASIPLGGAIEDEDAEIEGHAKNLSKELGWPDDTVARLTQQKREKWTGEEAVWLLDDE